MYTTLHRLFRGGTYGAAARSLRSFYKAVVPMAQRQYTMSTDFAPEGYRFVIYTMQSGNICGTKTLHTIADLSYRVNHFATYTMQNGSAYNTNTLHEVSGFCLAGAIAL